MTAVAFTNDSPPVPKRLTPATYFAGKISKNDWRVEIMGCRAGGVYEADALFDPNFMIEEDGFRYGGPFFVSCDHGCAHGPTEHGAGITLPLCVNGTNSFAQTIAQRRRAIFDINRRRLLRADHVFAYIDSADCYGTLVELGMAHARGKLISIGFASNLADDVRDELWVMTHTATRTFTGTAARCWELFRREVQL